MQGLVSVCKLMNKGELFVNSIVINCRSRIFLLKPEEVDSVSAASNYAWIHAGQQRYRTRTTIASLESKLDNTKFVRIHRSTIVNLEKIRLLRRENGILRVVLEGGQSFVVSRRYQPPVENLVIARNLIRKQIKTFGLKLRDLRVSRTAETLLVSERLEHRAM
jgi:DNA-binding LytR/AlgR family response regulator